MDTGVCFVTDTGTDLPGLFSNVIRVPLHFIFGDKSYEDETISDEDFVKMSALKWPNTSGPSAGEYVKAFGQAYEMGFRNILCLPISKALSGSYNTALTAVELVEQKDVNIKVIDTRSITLGIGYLIQKLFEMLEKPGVTIQDLVKVASEFYKSEWIYVVLNTLDNLVKGGRATRIQRQLAGLLKIKPIITLDTEGDLTVLSKVRTFSGALGRVVEYVIKTPNISNVGVMYSDNKGLAELFAESLLIALNENGVVLKDSDLPIIQVCRAIRVHAGKNAVGVCIAT